MKKIITIALVTFSLSGFSQEKDPSKVGRVTKDTMATPTYTYDLNDPLVAKYDYQKQKSKSNSIISRTEADSTYDLKGVRKFTFKSSFV